MKNTEIAKIFDEIADILEIKEENPFRIRAYRNAAQTIDALTEDIENLAKENKLTGLPGIGKDLAGKIEEYIKRGKIKFHNELKKSVPKAVMEFMSIPGIGPKTAKVLSSTLKIKNMKDLERKASQGKIKNVFGIKEKTVENILRGIDVLKRKEGRVLIDTAVEISGGILAQLSRLREVKKIIAAGSLRRMKETVRDIDILVTSDSPRKIMDAFIKLPEAKEILARGDTKSSMLTHNKIQVDIRVVKPSSFGSALCYFTGSKSHNIRLRKMAVRMGLKINEYGVFNVKTGRKIAGEEEEGIYKALRLAYVPPEMREDKGEIELASENKLPDLVELGDIKGDLHVHTESSDGALRIEEIASACQKKGYEYVVITDHSRTLKIAGGLSEKELLANVEKIRRLNKRLKGIRVLAGTEVDILGNGSLDYEDDILRELNFVIAAIHSGFKQAKDVITGRILRAMDNKYVNMLAHPTGRLIGTREPYDIDLEKILKKAKETGTAVEINAFPERLDLNDDACRWAKESGVMLGIATDTHTKGQLDNMVYGVSVARRGWLEKKDLLNTLGLKSFLKKIASKR